MVGKSLFFTFLGTKKKLKIKFSTLENPIFRKGRVCVSGGHFQVGVSSTGEHFPWAYFPRRGALLSRGGLFLGGGIFRRGVFSGGGGYFTEGEGDKHLESFKCIHSQSNNITCLSRR